MSSGKKRVGGVGGEEKKAAFRGNENSGLFQLFHPLPLPLSHLERSTKAVWNKKYTDADCEERQLPPLLKCTQPHRNRFPPKNEILLKYYHPLPCCGGPF